MQKSKEVFSLGLAELEEKEAKSNPVELDQFSLLCLLTYI